jgi:hypothetical protein
VHHTASFLISFFYLPHGHSLRSTLCCQTSCLQYVVATLCQHYVATTLCQHYVALPLSIYRIAITHYHLYSTIHYHCQPLSRLYSVTSIHTMPKLGGHYLLSTLCSPLHFSYIRQLPPLSKLAATTLGNIIWPETFVNNVKSMQPPLTL